MNFYNYIQGIKKNEEFKPAGINKEFYLDIIELSLNAYTKKELEERTLKFQESPVDDIHAYSRITSSIAALLANGRKQDFCKLWEQMMDVCCRDISSITKGSHPDFAVKELMLAYKAMKDMVSEEKRILWLNGLKKVEPYKNYAVTLGKSSVLHNINIYNMAGEYLRETEGLTDTADYFDKHWPVQLEKFDENGMYTDPGAPLLYDLSTRVQIQYILGAGYAGKYAGKLDHMLRSAGLMTLFMQSSAFVLPFGGRSNQFQFNEALIAANAEYEAVRYKKMGDLVTAGMFKRCAHLAAGSIKRWIEQEDMPRHIKNFYPIESGFGTENYGYYDKYMITLGCFVYAAFLFADDSIEEYPCPAETGGYVLETSNVFHKIFANCGGNSIEIDTNADFHYDATGLGRFHARGIPLELGLSLPFTKTPDYYIPEKLRRRNLSICPGWKTEEGNVQYLSELNGRLKHALTVHSFSKEEVSLTVVYWGEEIDGCRAVKETYSISPLGVDIETSLEGALCDKLYYAIPLFYSNGKDKSKIRFGGRETEVVLGDSSYQVASDGTAILEEGLFGNRNGEYKLLTVNGDSCRMKIHLFLKKLI